MTDKKRPVQRKHSSSVSAQVDAAAGRVMQVEWPAHIPLPIEDAEADVVLDNFEGFCSTREKINKGFVESAAALAIVMLERTKVMHQIQMEGWTVTRMNTSGFETTVKNPLADVHSMLDAQRIRAAQKLGLFLAEAGKDKRSEQNRAAAGHGVKLKRPAKEAEVINWNDRLQAARQQYGKGDAE